MQAEILLTLKLQQRLFADPRRIELLRQVRHTGSISQGAKLANISYNSAWAAINEMNQLADQTLVDRSTGGKGGGGAVLTPYGERLPQLHEFLGHIQPKAFAVLKEDSLPIDSLLAAISRFSLQTSARNQFFGNVIERDNRTVQQHIDILLADGKTQIRAAITEQSADRLALAPGKEVLVLIKAPWITLGFTAENPHNALPGIVTSIQRGENNSEVLMQLQSSEILCATVPNTDVDNLALKTGQSLYAQFDDDKVILATLC